MSADHGAILAYYRNKALAAVRDVALPLLAQSEDAGYWLPGASRKVRSLLAKVHPKEVEAAIAEASAMDPYSGLAIDIEYGRLGRATLAADELVGDALARWWSAFEPVAALMARLDAERPKPTYAIGAVSAATAKNVGASMGLDLASFEVPPIDWKKTQQPVPGVPGGATITVWIGVPRWPAGTLHNKSRYAGGSRAGNAQCHACGHAIRNPHNWVPVAAFGADGVPHSLWIGKDCAGVLLGISVKNEAGGRLEQAVRDTEK